MSVAPDNSRAAFTDPGSVSLAELLRVLWNARVLVAVCALLSAAVAGGLFLLVPKVYRATALVAPVETGAPAALGGITGRLGGLADLVGLGASNSGRKQEAIAVLQSDALASRYIADKGLLPVLFADKWDAGKGGWIVEQGEVPTIWQATREFARHRRVAENTKTGLVQLIVEWGDADIAASWANDLVALTNEHLRQEAIVLAERNIAYLSEQAEKSSLLPVRNSMYQLIEDEMRSLMLARGNDSYALRIIDPAVAPEKSSTPGMLIWLIAGAVGGCGFGLMLALILFGFRR